MRKSKLGFELETCSRCGGTGQYSYCQRFGTTCFKCGGSGVVLTKKGSAAKEHFNSSMLKDLSKISIGDLIKDGNKWRKLEEIQQETGCYQKLPDGTKIHHGSLLFNGGGYGLGFVKGEPSSFTSVKNNEEWQKLLKEAHIHQDKLTKAGKLMKKHQ